MLSLKLHSEELAELTVSSQPLPVSRPLTPSPLSPFQTYIESDYELVLRKSVEEVQ